MLASLISTENEPILTALANIETLQDSLDFSGPLSNESLAHNLKINTKLMTALEKLIKEFRDELSAEFLESLNQQSNCYNNIDSILTEVYQKMQGEDPNQHDEEMNEPEELIPEISADELSQFIQKINDRLVSIQQLAKQGIIYEESFIDIITFYENLISLQNNYKNTAAFIETSQSYQENIHLCQIIAKEVIEIEIKAYKTGVEYIQQSVQDNLILKDAKSSQIKADLAMNKNRILKSRFEQGFELIKAHITLFEQLSRSNPDAHLANEILLRRLRTALLNTISAALPELISHITTKDDKKYSDLNHYIQLLCNESTPTGKEHIKDVLQHELDKLRKTRDSDATVWKAYAIVDGLNIIKNSIVTEVSDQRKNLTSAKDMIPQLKS